MTAALFGPLLAPNRRARRLFSQSDNEALSDVDATPQKTRAVGSP